jgi:exonuclease III
MRIVAWNIRAGGGRRSAAIAAQLARWNPDVAALCEFRGTAPSAAIAAALADLGLVHQLATVAGSAASANALLVASRWPLRRLRTPRAPVEAGRWLLVSVAAPAPFGLGAMHVPNRVTGRKWAFLDSVLAVASAWRDGPALLVGDTNSGQPGIDEEVPAFNRREGAWMEALDRAGWRDAFRHLRGNERVYTWYSPNGDNGFRIDQAFLTTRLLPRLAGVQHEWGRARPGKARTTRLSDHAALLLDLHDATRAAREPRRRSSVSGA